MIKKSGKRGKIEYRNPIDLNEHDKCSDIEIVAVQYEHRQDNDYEYCLGKGHRMQLKDVSMGVVLTINDDGLYRLNDDDVTCLTKLLH